MSGRLWAGCAVLGTALCLSCGSSNRTGIVYLVGQSDQTVGAYKLNLKTGVLNTKNNALAPIGTPAKTGTQPTVLLFDPPQMFAYVADSGSNDIASFSVNHDGSLAAGGTTVLKAPATNPAALAMDPGGKFLFVADEGIPGDPNCGAHPVNGNPCQAGISVFTVSSGKLTEVAGSPFSLLSDANTIANFPAPVIPTSLAVSNTGSFLYATDKGNNIVVGFTYDTTTGVLTPLPNSGTAPISPVVVGNAPSGLLSPPLANFLYVTNFVSNDIFEFKIETDGGLTPVVGSPVPASTGPTVMLSDANVKYLFAVANGSNQLLGYRVNQVTGALTALTPSSVSTGLSPVAATIRSNGITNGDYWLVVSDNGANAVTTIDLVNSTGSMSVLPQLNGPVAPYGIGSR